MADPVMSSVAAAVAGKAAEAAVQGGRVACAALVKIVRERCHRDKRASEALEAACSAPAEAAIAELTWALERLAAADPVFVSQLRDLWPRVTIELSDDSSVINSVTGSVGGHLLQARDVHIEGGLHFGETRGPDRP